VTTARPRHQAVRYDYTIYGSLSGVGGTSLPILQGETPAPDARPYYRVSVAASIWEDLGVRQQKIEMAPRPAGQANFTPVKDHPALPDQSRCIASKSATRRSKRLAGQRWRLSRPYPWRRPCVSLLHDGRRGDRHKSVQSVPRRPSPANRRADKNGLYRHDHAAVDTRRSHACGPGRNL